MQMTQLSAYSRNVPKFEASVTVISELGSAAIVSWEKYPKLDQKPCGSALITVSGGAPLSPKTIRTPMQPTTAEIPANAQIARCGVRFLECSRPKFAGTSSSLPMTYVTRAPVFIQE